MLSVVRPVVSEKGCGLGSVAAMGKLASFRLVAAGVAVALLAALAVNAPEIAHADASTGVGGLFVSNTSRVYDTGSGTGGAPTAGLGAGNWYSIPIEGVGGIPATGVSAVQVNFVVTNSTSTAGSLHADKGGVASPNTTVAYANYPANTSVANAATLAVGSNGSIQVEASTAVNLRVDVQGYYSSGATAAGGYVPLAASVVANTSDGTGGVPTAKVASQSTLTFPVAGSAGVPTDASGVVLNIQESGSATTGGYIIPFGAGQPRPATTLYWPGQRIYDWTTNVNLPSSGGVSIYVAGGPINLIVSVEGYFTANVSGNTAGQFTPAATRVYDSRSTGNAPFASGEARTIQIAGTHGVPVVGAGVTSVAVDITVIPPAGSSGSVSAYSDDASPGPDTGYFVANSTMTVFAIVPIGADGGIIVQNNSGGSAAVVLDVEGWYSGPTQASISCPSPYTDGSWQVAVPSSPITCTATLPATDDMNASVLFTVDDQGAEPTDVTPGQPTVVSAEIPAEGGTHVLQAITTLGDGVVTTTTYRVGLGDWSTKMIVPSVGDGALQYSNGQINIGVSGDDFAPDTQYEYFVTTNPDGVTNPLVTPVWASGSFDLTQLGLVAGATYYWSVAVSGTAGGRSTISSIRSSVWSFVATDTDLTADLSTADGVHSETGTVNPDGSLNVAPDASGSSPKVLAATPNNSTLNCNQYYGWTDFNGKLSMQHVCGSNVTAWTYVISAAVCGLLAPGSANERGMTWKQNNVQQKGKVGKAHRNVCGYIIHGSLNSGQKQAGMRLDLRDIIDETTADGAAAVLIVWANNVKITDNRCTSKTSC